MDSRLRGNDILGFHAIGLRCGEVGVIGLTVGVAGVILLVYLGWWCGFTRRGGVAAALHLSLFWVIGYDN